MHTRLLTLSILLGAMLGVAQAQESPIAESTPRPSFTPLLPIPGLQAMDQTPNACVDCHVRQGDVDMRLSTRIAALGMGAPEELMAKARAAAPKGKELGGWHPNLPPAAFGNIPGACLRCHKQDSQMAPPFSRLIHLIHLTEASFAKDAGGGCGSCHKLDGNSGQWAIPNGAER